MGFLNTWDIGVILFYFVGLIVIGHALKRRAAGSIEDYFLAGRKMPWWALGLSGMAAWLDMTGTMMVASFLYLLGPRGLYIEFRGGAGLVLVFMMLWLGKWHRRSGVMTMAEWMIFRFGSSTGGHLARQASVIAFIATTIGMLAYSFKGAGLFLSMFLPLSPFWCAVVMLLITTIYTLEAGFYGVIFSDIFQTLFIWIGVIFIIVLAVLKVGSGAELAEVATSVSGNPDWMTVTPQWETAMPKGYEGYSLLTMLTGFYLLKTLIQGMGFPLDAKYFGAKSDRDCGLLSFLSGWLLMLRWPLMLGCAILGLYLVKEQFPDQHVLAEAAALIQQHAPVADQAQWPERIAEIMNHTDRFPAGLTEGLAGLFGDDWKSKLSLLSYHGTIDPERIMPAVILFNIPPGLRGMLLVALLAAAMSTFSAMINTAASYITRDFYQGYLRPSAPNKELIYVSYVASAVLALVGMLMAYSARSITDIWGWISMGLIGGMSAPLLLRLYWWRFNGMGFFVGILSGLVGALVQRSWWPDLPEWGQFVLMLSISLVGSLLGTFLSPPTQREVLERFYRTTRPFGFWGPLRGVLNEPERQDMKREHRFDLISAPFALLWLVTVLLLPMQLMIRVWRPATVTGILFLVSLAGLYWFWYRKLPPKDAAESVEE